MLKFHLLISICFKFISFNIKCLLKECGLFLCLTPYHKSIHTSGTADLITMSAEYVSAQLDTVAFYLLELDKEASWCPQFI
jgi:hypothetical protein